MIFASMGAAAAANPNMGVGGAFAAGVVGAANQAANISHLRAETSGLLTSNAVNLANYNLRAGLLGLPMLDHYGNPQPGRH